MSFASKRSQNFFRHSGFRPQFIADGTRNPASLLSTAKSLGPGSPLRGVRDDDKK
ncbi:MAG: hypothetical protein OJF61_000568 [Rhodanobacteraceae bacterium]|nr:MAG: hypothetical protein OJF61_000568 [Rhodanobacteraceae bacterium]